jgi:secreted PhoX family phosphatase
MKSRVFKFVTSVGLALLVAMGLMSAAVAQDAAPIVPLTDPMAPFLESRAFAVSKGATAEFNKMEWVAVDPINNKLYIAMSDITKAMSDGEGAIKLEENRCGIIYVADMDKDYNISALKPLIVGGPYDKEAKPNKCNVDNISNPDSVFVDTAGNLWIGEDTSNHKNNILWRYNIKTSKLERFAILPAGAEVTGFYATSAGDIFVNAQHPSGMNPYPYNRGFIGVVNGFKATDTFTALAAPTSTVKEMKVAAGSYQVLARAGTLIPGDFNEGRFGEVIDASGEMMFICNHPDGNMYLPTNDEGTEGYLYTNYECQPGAVSKIYIKKASKNWAVLEGENVDFASVNGTWNNCGASVTPWNTAMTAEEYEPPALADSWKDNVAAMTEYMGAQANPYDYGWLVEMAPDAGGDIAGTVMQKRYAMGRFSHEMAAFAPDNKTVYHGDDGANVVLFKFVADEAGNLSAGTLYAATITQDGENLSIKWVELGKGNDEEIAEAISAITLPK